MNWIQVETPYGIGTVLGNVPDIEGGPAILVAIKKKNLQGLTCDGPVKNMTFRWCEIHKKATVGRCMECLQLSPLIETQSYTSENLT
jgi:hypothetical protein